MGEDSDDFWLIVPVGGEPRVRPSRVGTRLFYHPDRSALPGINGLPILGLCSGFPAGGAACVKYTDSALVSFSVPKFWPESRSSLGRSRLREDRAPVSPPA